MLRQASAFVACRRKADALDSAFPTRWSAAHSYSSAFIDPQDVVMRSTFTPIAVLSLVALLSACGGGGGDFRNEPRASARNGALTVSAGGDANLNGLYTSSDVQLNDVEKFNPIGGEPETCRTHFAALVQTPGGRVMDGELRYLPGTSLLRSTFISINTIEFKMDNSTGASVDRGNNVINFAGAVLTSTQGSGQSITLTGSVPIRAENKPEGC
jgi:hypothetical protein